MSDAELDELLAAASAPTPAIQHVMVTKSSFVAKFIREHEIERGHALAIETSELYQMYLAWATKLEGESQIVTPHFFAVWLGRKGFERGRHYRRGRDCRPLMTSAKTAFRLKAWLREHPITKEQRLMFTNRWRKMAEAKWSGENE